MVLYATKGLNLYQKHVTISAYLVLALSCKLRDMIVLMYSDSCHVWQQKLAKRSVQTTLIKVILKFFCSGEILIFCVSISLHNIRTVELCNWNAMRWMFLCAITDIIFLRCIQLCCAILNHGVACALSCLTVTNIYSHVPTPLTLFPESRVRAANIVRRPCSDSSHVTAPYRLVIFFCVLDPARISC